MSEKFSDKMRVPHKAVAVGVLACIAVFFALKAAGLDREASGAIYAAVAVLVVQHALMIFIPRPKTSFGANDTRGEGR